MREESEGVDFADWKNGDFVGFAEAKEHTRTPG